MAELNRREAQKNFITRMHTFTQSEEFNNADLRLLREQTHLLKAAFEKYIEEHLSVVENVTRPQDLEVQHEARTAVQEIYLLALTALDKRMDDIIEQRMEAVEGQIDANAEAENEAERQNGDDGNQPQNGRYVRQPRMSRDEYLLDHFKPPKFNGTYSKWCEWRSAYVSMIHPSTLSDTRKMYMLKQCLRGSAERILSGWQILSDNYLSAYETLCSVYQNTYRIIMSHLDDFFKMPKLECIKKHDRHNE